MFGNRYFGGRHFGHRYFGALGASPAGRVFKWIMVVRHSRRPVNS